MEKVELNYCYRDEDDEETIITISKKNEDGLSEYDVCEMFEDFMNVLGFSKENVFKYFNK